MKEQTQKQILEWKEELKNHKERLQQAQAVVEQESKLISMIEGGIQFGELALKKIESSDQPSNKEAPDPQSKTEQAKKQELMPLKKLL